MVLSEIDSQQLYFDITTQLLRGVAATGSQWPAGARLGKEPSWFRSVRRIESNLANLQLLKCSFSNP